MLGPQRLTEKSCDATCLAEGYVRGSGYDWGCIRPLGE
jgi:hypothetical protein